MPFSLEESIDILNRTPKALSTLLENLPDSWAHGNEGEGTFSPHDVLGHLIFAEQEDWIPRVRLILTSGESTPFTPFDRRGHESFTSMKSTAELISEFTEWRASCIQTLRSFELDDTALDRKGTHPDLGPVTLRQLLATWVAHDLSHIAQIARVMAKQYQADVGPWRAYMSILR